MLAQQVYPDNATVEGRVIEATHQQHRYCRPGMWLCQPWLFQPGFQAEGWGSTAGVEATGDGSLAGKSSV
jgi:hypothetical protein